MALKHLDGKTRGKDYPDIFMKAGHIKVDRLCADPAPLAWIHGLPTAVVYLDYYALLGAKVASMTGYSVGLSACKKEGKEKLRWLNVVLGAKDLQAITRAGASPVRRFNNWRCSRTSPLYSNEEDKKYDAINGTHSDYVILLSDNGPTFTPL